jgi:hypothetical protein
MSTMTDLNQKTLSGQHSQGNAQLVAEKYGKDTVLSIFYLGTSKLPFLFAVKRITTGRSTPATASIRVSDAYRSSPIGNDRSNRLKLALHAMMSRSVEHEHRSTR